MRAGPFWDTLAGANHAWYEGWIAEPKIDAEFMAAAVDAVLAQQQPVLGS